MARIAPRGDVGRASLSGGALMSRTKGKPDEVKNVTEIIAPVVDLMRYNSF